MNKLNQRIAEVEKDWTGNKKTTFVQLASSNHTDKEREKNDFYATEPKAGELLMQVEDLNNIWECACGEGHLSEVFKKYNKLSKSSDLIDRGYGEVLDFFKLNEWNGDIVTNPPYKYAQEFVEHALKIIPDKRKVAMFLKIQFLESKGRKELFKINPPKVVYVSSSRLNCARNAKFEEFDSSAVAYCWFVWEKGFKGDTIIKWIN